MPFLSDAVRTSYVPTLPYSTTARDSSAAACGIVGYVCPSFIHIHARPPSLLYSYIMLVASEGAGAAAPPGSPGLRGAAAGLAALTAGLGGLGGSSAAGGAKAGGAAPPAPGRRGCATGCAGVWSLVRLRPGSLGRRGTLGMLGSFGGPPGMEDALS